MRAKDFLIEGYKEVRDKFIQVADPQTVNNTIELFKQLVNKNQVQGNERMIDYWGKQGWDSFKDYVSSRATIPTKTQVKTKKAIGKSIPLIDDDKWLVIIPLDKDASCFYGRESSWCTTKHNANHFEHYFYKRDVTLIYCIHKQSGNMWAVAGHQNLEQVECFDQMDHPLTPDDFTAQTGMVPSNLVALAHRNHKSTIDGSKTKFKQYSEKLTPMLQDITERNAEVEQMLLFMKDGPLCRQYVDRLVAYDQDVTQLPEGIIRALVGYNAEYLEYFPHANEATQVDAATAGSVALKFIPNPSDKVLNMAFTNHYDSLKYITDPDLQEKLIMKYPKAAMYYAVYMEKRRIPTLEPKIAKDVISASFYLKVMHEPWPDGEESILQNEVAIPQYVKTNLKGQTWKAGEQALLKIGDPYYMYEYAAATKKRFIAAEDKIVKDVETAAAYATDILQKPWPDIEDELYEINPADSDAAENYAKEFNWIEYMDHWPKYFEKYFDDLRTRKMRGGRYYNDDDY